MSGTLLRKRDTAQTLVEGAEHKGQSLDEILESLSIPAEPIVKAVDSSGCVFYPPSNKFWRIGGKWYDFNNITKVTDKPFNHPGGAEILRMARDRYEDSTYAFEAHHHEYKRVRAIIRKYEVKGLLSAELTRRAKVIADKKPNVGFHNRNTPEARSNGTQIPQLADDKAFYSVVRRRVSKYLKEVGCRHGGPTRQSILLFWSCFVGMIITYSLLVYTGSMLVIPICALMCGLTGAYGHNWIHQPRYKHWGYLSMDPLGMSSDCWFREHVLQHHMYTNTPWDNHFRGTEPFFVTDPTRKRSILEKYFYPAINPLILSLGIYANWGAHLIETIKGNEKIQPFKYLFLVTWGLPVYFHGWWGALISYTLFGAMSIWYFTMALMNHNAAHTHDVQARNNSSDWGVAQLHASADWGTHLSFLQASRYLWLNYHTVHHLFPRTDFCHHAKIQEILMETCKEYNVNYVAGNPWTIYKEMIVSFATPRALLEEVSVYGMKL